MKEKLFLLGNCFGFVLLLVCAIDSHDLFGFAWIVMASCFLADLIVFIKKP